MVGGGEEGLNDMMKKAILCSNICGSDMYIYPLSVISQNLAQTMLPYEECNKGNKQRYNQYRQCHSYLMIGLNHDAVSGWLWLASLFYRYKQYRECIHVIEYCLTKCTPDKFLLTNKPDVEDQSRFERFMHILGRGNFLSTCKQCLIDDIWFWNPSHTSLDEIRCVLWVAEMTDIPSVVFAHLLKFLCFCHLGNQRGKQEAFRDLQLTIIERYFISQNQDIIENANLCFQIAQEMMIQNS